MLFLQLLFATASLAAVIPSSAPTPTSTSLANLAARETTASEESNLDTTALPTGIFTTTDHIIIDGVTNSHVTIPAKTIDISRPTCIQTITPDGNGYVPPGTCGAIWDYYPKFIAAIVFAALFAIVTAVHVWQAAKYKKTWCWVIIMASLWETMAFVFRALSSKHQQSSGIYLVFQIFILLAPLWVNAFAYMTLGRMVYYFLPSRSILRMPAATLAAIFVGLDIVSFIIQLVGGTMASPHSPYDEQQKAIHIYMGGIGLQEFFILVFVGLCIVFQREVSKLDGHGRGFMNFFRAPWGILLCTLYFSLAAITVRIVYRLIEFSGGMGQDNDLTTHEAYFYILEAVPMFFAIMAFNLVHPGRIMTGPESEMPGLFSTLKAKFSRRKHQKLMDDASSEEMELAPGYEMRPLNH
ncbi:Fc.00g094570.m01.CDS01 [Cosmosporella sp. VM-42]